jgi:Flp pilus assembly protein TadB
VDRRAVIGWLPLAGLGAGTGAVLVLFGFFGIFDRVGRRSRAAVQAVEGEVTRAGAPDPGGRGASPLNRRARLGTALLAAIGRVSPRTRSSAADLAMLGTTSTAHAIQVATAALAGFAIVPVLAAVAALCGIGVAPELPLAGCVCLGAVAALMPVIELRRKSTVARRSFRQALACWLELVALAQAAGMGIESALQSASTLSDDERFRRIRVAVERARHAGRTPWAGLGQLGEELAIPELIELGATLSLAGVEGARIRGSLAARALALRQKELNDAEADANATTERLFLPSIVLMLGFLLFVGYPAVVTLMHTI